MKEDLIRQLKDAHQRLLKAVALIPEDQPVNKEWSKKELLSHIAGWYEEGVDGMNKILKGKKPNSFRMSIDGYNKRSVAKRKSMSEQQIHQEMEQLVQQLLTKLQTLTDEQITGHFGTTLGKKPINLLWQLHEQISHDNSHAEELEKKYA